ncbi:hypothetical protein D3C80_1272530 [compost metagenome]
MTGYKMAAASIAEDRNFRCAHVYGIPPDATLFRFRINVILLSQLHANCLFTVSRFFPFKVVK